MDDWLALALIEVGGMICGGSMWGEGLREVGQLVLPLIGVAGCNQGQAGHGEELWD